MFDWVAFFQRYSIEYVETIRVGRGNVGIKCPWCSNPTHLDHLGVGPNGYYCWKGGKAHSGKSPQRLIVALIRCSWEQANQIVGTETTSYATADATFAEDSMRRLGIVVSEQRKVINTGGLEPLPEFKPLRDSGLSRILAMPYLRRRGYDTDDALRLAERYGLMFAASGPFSYRIIVPVIVGGRLVTWTGRTVAASEDLRYRTLSTDLDKAASRGLPTATMNIKDTLLDWDNVRRGGELLVLTEGPFDALRLGFLGERRGIRATCLFGKAVAPAQIDRIAEIAGRYEKVVALFDRDAGFEAFAAMPDYLGVRELRLPAGVKDPAELAPSEFDQLFRGVL